MPGIVEINSNYYKVLSVQQTYVPRQSQAFRLQGVQQRSDDPSIGRYKYAGFPLGLGWSRQNRETGRGVGGVTDTTCDLLHRLITLPRLEETQTHAAPADHFKKAVHFKGDLWGLFEENYSAVAETSIMSRLFGATSDNWTGGGEIANGTGVNAVGIRIFDVVVHKNNMFVLHSGDTAGVTAAEEPRYIVSSSTDGITWTAATGTGFVPALPDFLTTTVTRRNNHDDDMGKLLSFGNTLLAARWRDPSSTNGDGNIEVLSSVDSGVTWISQVTIPSGSGPKAFVSWYDLSLTRSPVLVTAEGIYAINLDVGTFELIHGLDGNAANGRWSIVGNDGNLYVGLATGDIARLSIQIPNNLSVPILRPGGDGLVLQRTGRVNFMENYQNYLLVGYGGHAASRNASVFAIDTSAPYTDPETGRAYLPWYHVYREVTADQDIIALVFSTEDDGIPRLHFALEGTSASELLHIERPFDDPVEFSGLIKYASAGNIRIPSDDFGDPHETTTVIRALMDADDLSATNAGEYIALQYGTNAQADDATTLDDFLSGTLILNFEAPASNDGEGVAGRRMGNRLVFNRDAADNTQTPKMREFEMQARNVYHTRLRTTMMIDIAGSPPPAQTVNQQNPTTVIANLRTIATSTTMVTFTLGEDAQTRVWVSANAPPIFDLQVMDSAIDEPGFLSGTCTLTVEAAR